MSNELATSIVVVLTGNLQRQSKRNSLAIKQFSRSATGSLNVVDQKLKKTTSLYSTMAKRIGAIAVGMKAINASRKVIDFDASLAQLQTDGQLSAEDIARIKAKIFEVANQPDIRLDPLLLQTGFAEIISQTGQSKEAEENLRNLALLIRATGTEAQTAGALVALAFKQGETEPKKVTSILGVMLKQSLVGSVPLRDLAREGKGFAAPAAAAIGPGAQTIIDSSAVAQITIDAVKTPAVATEAINALLRVLKDDELQGKFRNAGVELKQSNGKLRQLSEIIPEIFDVLGGDAGRLQKIFGDSAVKVFDGFALPGNREQLKKLASLEADGSLLKKNAQINASTAKAALQSISNKTTAGADNLFSDDFKAAATGLDTFEENYQQNKITAILTTLKGLFVHSATTSPFANFLKSSDFINAMSIDNTPEGIEKFNALVAKGQEPGQEPQVQQEPAVQRSKIELEIKSDQKVIVNSIQSDTVDISVDTGKVMP